MPSSNAPAIDPKLSRFRDLDSVNDKFHHSLIPKETRTILTDENGQFVKDDTPRPYSFDCLPISLWPAIGSLSNKLYLRDKSKNVPWGRHEFRKFLNLSFWMGSCDVSWQKEIVIRTIVERIAQGKIVMASQKCVVCATCPDDSILLGFCLLPLYNLSLPCMYSELTHVGASAHPRRDSGQMQQRVKNPAGFRLPSLWFGKFPMFKADTVSNRKEQRAFLAALPNVDNPETPSHKKPTAKRRRPDTARPPPRPSSSSNTPRPQSESPTPSETARTSPASPTPPKKTSKRRRLTSPVPSIPATSTTPSPMISSKTAPSHNHQAQPSSRSDGVLAADGKGSSSIETETEKQRASRIAAEHDNYVAQLESEIEQLRCQAEGHAKEMGRMARRHQKLTTELKHVDQLYEVQSSAKDDVEKTLKDLERELKDSSLVHVLLHKHVEDSN